MYDTNNRDAILPEEPIATDPCSRRTLTISPMQMVNDNYVLLRGIAHNERHHRGRGDRRNAHQARIDGAQVRLRIAALCLAAGWAWTSDR